MGNMLFNRRLGTAEDPDGELCKLKLFLINMPCSCYKVYCIQENYIKELTFELRRLILFFHFTFSLKIVSEKTLFNNFKVFILQNLF